MLQQQTQWRRAQVISGPFILVWKSWSAQDCILNGVIMLAHGHLGSDIPRHPPRSPVWYSMRSLEAICCPCCWLLNSNISIHSQGSETAFTGPSPQEWDLEQAGKRTVEMTCVQLQRQEPPPRLGLMCWGRDRSQWKEKSHLAFAWLPPTGALTWRRCN